MLCGKLFDEFLASRLDLAPRTLDCYRRLIRYADGIRAIDASQLTDEHIRKILEPHLCHLRTAHQILAFLKMVLPIKTSIRLPAYEPSERKVLNPAEIRKLSTAIRGHRHELEILLGLCCGMRRGEICGLRYEDCTEGMIHIRRQIVVTDDGKAHETKPKTKAGIRTIPMPERVRELTEGRFGHVTELTPNGLYQCLQDILIQNGLPRLGMHALRHTMATSAVRHGADMRSLQIVLGHANYSTTAMLYTHPDYDMTMSVIARACSDML